MPIEILESARQLAGTKTDRIKLTLLLHGASLKNKKLRRYTDDERTHAAYKP